MKKIVVHEFSDLSPELQIYVKNKTQLAYITEKEDALLNEYHAGHLTDDELEAEAGFFEGGHNGKPWFSPAEYHDGHRADVDSAVALALKEGLYRKDGTFICKITDTCVL